MCFSPQVDLDLRLIIFQVRILLNIMPLGGYHFIFRIYHITIAIELI